MISLDNITLLLAQSVMAGAIAIFSFFHSRKVEEKRLRLYWTANLIYFVAVLSLITQPVLPPLFSVLFANGLLVVAMWFLSAGMLRLLDIEMKREYLYLLLVIFFAGMYFFTYVGENTIARIIVYSITQCLIIGYSIVLMVRGDSRFSRISRFVIVIQSIYFLVNGLRALLNMLFDPGLDSIFITNMATSLLFLLSMVYHTSLNIVIFIAFLSLYEEKINSKVILLKELHDDITRLNSFYSLFLNKRPVETLYSEILDFIRIRFEIESIALCRLNETGHELEVIKTHGFSDDIVSLMNLFAVEPGTISGRAVIEKRPQFLDIKDYPETPVKELLIRDSYRMIVSFPLYTSRGVLGTFTMGLKRGELMTEDDVSLLELVCRQVGSIMENIILYNEIDTLARSDALTGIANRRHFLEYFERAFYRSKRYKRELTFIMFDLDNFKKVNDTYGHLAGDYVLQEMCRVIQSALRSCDFFGRYGGEEFAISMEETGCSGAFVLAERIRVLVMEYPFVFENEKLPVTISIGISCINEGDTSVDQLIRRADDALYQAKRNGRNQTQQGG